MTRAWWLCAWLPCTLLGAGCPGLRRHVAHDAPGHVDLATPMPGERGDPAAYVEPTDPGEHQLGIAPGASVLLTGEGAETHAELGADVHVSFGERAQTGHRGALGYPFDAWGATLGGAYDPDDDRPTLWLEGTRTWYVFRASGGLAVDPTPGAVDVGAQLTLHAAIFAVRLRYLAERGFEAFAGYHVYLPASVTWSR